MELQSLPVELFSLCSEEEGRSYLRWLFCLCRLSFNAAAHFSIKFKRSVNNSAVIEQFKQKLLKFWYLGDGEEARKREPLLNVLPKPSHFLMPLFNKDSNYWVTTEGFFFSRLYLNLFFKIDCWNIPTDEPHILQWVQNSVYPLENLRVWVGYVSQY